MTLEHLYLVIGTAALNGAVIWGVVKTQLAWLRRDVDLAHHRISKLREDFARLGGRRQQARDEEES